VRRRRGGMAVRMVGVIAVGWHFGRSSDLSLALDTL
jgi:hypothetical protein